MTYSQFLLFYFNKGPFRPIRESAARKFCRRNKGLSLEIVTKHELFFKVIIGDAVDSSIFLYGEFEPLTTRIISHLSQYSNFFVDIGCNIGYYSCLFAKKAKNAHIHSIDANPIMIERTKENLELNNVNNYFLHNAGVSSKTENLVLHIPRERHSLSSFAYKPTGSGDINSITVKADTLMNVLGDSLCEHAIMKIDVEGFELKVFQGISEIESKLFDHIIFELSLTNCAAAGVDINKIFSINWFSDFHIYSIDQRSNKIKKFNYLATKGILETNIWMIRKNIFNNPIIDSLLKSGTEKQPHNKYMPHF